MKRDWPFIISQAFILIGAVALLVIVGVATFKMGH